MMYVKPLRTKQDPGVRKPVKSKRNQVIHRNQKDLRLWIQEDVAKKPKID